MILEVLEEKSDKKSYKENKHNNQYTLGSDIDERIAKAVNLRNKGLTRADIGKILGVTTRAVDNYLKNANSESNAPII